MNPRYRNLITFTACLLLAGTACNRADYEDEESLKIVGDWKLQYFKQGTSDTDFPYTHNWISTPSEEYTLHVKKNGRICSRKNGDRIWHDRIVRATYHDSWPQIDGLVSMRLDEWENEYFGVWFVGDSLFCSGLPLPTVNCSQHPNWCDRVAVYLPE